MHPLDSAVKGKSSDYKMSLRMDKRHKKLTIFGLNGGRTFRCSNASQSRSLKNACPRICVSFPVHPSRRAGFLVIKPRGDELIIIYLKNSLIPTHPSKWTLPRGLAKLDRAHHHVELIRISRPHCLPRTAAGQPSSRT